MMIRRDVLVGLASLTGAAAAIPFAELIAARGEQRRVRYNATSTEGKKMLKLYAAGVGALRAKQPSDPLSWTFQWYMHQVSGATDKKAAIEKIFGPDKSDGKDLALQLWNTCQAHDGGMKEFNFLPWHRAYVLFFERIIRSVTTDEFTLPYWDYTTDAALPIEFRKENDSEFGVLYVKQRNKDANDGKPIADKALINLDSLKQTAYLPGSGSVPAGFNAQLDGSLHGNVHVYTGNGLNMGSVKYAAYDPVFWIHHCNIDRIWAAWNANGGKNPTDDDWLTQSHGFVTKNAKLALVANANVTDIGKLDYKYDALPSRPSVTSQVASSTRKTKPISETTVVIATLGRAVTLGAKPTDVKLMPSANAAAQTRNTAQSTYLVIGDIHTNAQPGVAYLVYATGRKDARTLLGSIQFFDGQTQKADSQRKFVFDITELVEANKDADPLTYEIVPAGEPSADASPVVGSMEIIGK